MNIGEVTKGIFLFLFEDATTSLIEPFLNFIEIIALSPSILQKMPFIDPLYLVSQKIGAGILILIVTWQGLKSMMVGVGFEADEPVKIAAKTFISGFLMLSIKDILMQMVKIANEFNQAIMDAAITALDGAGLAEIVMKILTGGLTSAVYMILGIVVVFKLIGLMFKMFKRLVICAFLLICSPLAVACMVSKNTEGFMQGFIKLFAGNIAIQIVQSMCIVASFVTLENGFAGSSVLGTPDVNDFFSIMVTIAIITVTDILEDILRDISVTVGVGRDMQGAIGKLQGAAYTAMTLQGAGRFIKG